MRKSVHGLQRYLDLKHRIPRETRVKLIKVLYEVVTTERELDQSLQRNLIQQVNPTNRCYVLDSFNPRNRLCPSAYSRDACFAWMPPAHMAPRFVGACTHSAHQPYWHVLLVAICKKRI
jgi:hypothetical protein